MVGALAAGDFDYNNAYVTSNLNWTPTNLIQISSPTNNASYSYLSVPNLVATAGQLASQIIWTSNINGTLGTGSNISVVGKLTPGNQVITASLSSSVVATIHFTVTAPAAKLSSSPNLVVIPYGQTSTSFTLTWTAPGYSNISLYGKQNLQNPGQIVCLGNSGGSGSAVEGLASNEIATLWLLPFENCVPNSIVAALPASALATLSLTATQGAQPTLTTNPSALVIPYGQTSISYVLNWTAPGYSQVSLYGRQNLQNPNEIVCLGNSNAPGSAVESIALNEIADIWLFSSTNCSPGYVVSTLPSGAIAHVTIAAVQGNRSTLSATPNPVVIPSGQTSASFTLSWSAPGYSQVSLYGEQNQVSPGQIICLGNVGGSGSAVQGLTTGETATLYLTQNNNCAPGNSIGTAAPPNVLATLTLTAH